MEAFHHIISPRGADLEISKAKTPALFWSPPPKKPEQSGNCLCECYNKGIVDSPKERYYATCNRGILV